jgi:hypothetical protein
MLSRLTGRRLTGGQARPGSDVRDSHSGDSTAANAGTAPSSSSSSVAGATGAATASKSRLVAGLAKRLSFERKATRVKQRQPAASADVSACSGGGGGGSGGGGGGATTSVGHSLVRKLSFSRCRSSQPTQASQVRPPTDVGQIPVQVAVDFHSTPMVDFRKRMVRKLSFERKPLKPRENNSASRPAAQP